MNGPVAKIAAYPDEFVLKVVKAYRDDPRACTVADRFGIHHSTVKRWAAAYGGRGIGESNDDCGGSGASLGKADKNNGGAAATAHAGNGGNGKQKMDGALALVIDACEKPQPIYGALAAQPDEQDAQDATPDQNETETPPAPKLDPRVDDLIKQVEHAYLKHILKPDCVEGSAPKDAAAVFKTVAEVELKRAAHKILIESKAAEIEEGGEGLKPGLLGWEKVLLRLTAGDEDE